MKVSLFLFGANMSQPSEPTRITPVTLSPHTLELLLRPDLSTEKPDNIRLFLPESIGRFAFQLMRRVVALGVDANSFIANPIEASTVANLQKQELQTFALVTRFAQFTEDGAEYLHSESPRHLRAGALLRAKWLLGGGEHYQWAGAENIRASLEMLGGTLPGVDAATHRTSSS